MLKILKRYINPRYGKRTCVSDEDLGIFNAFWTIGSDRLVENETCNHIRMSYYDEEKGVSTNLRQDMSPSAFRRLF